LKRNTLRRISSRGVPASQRAGTGREPIACQTFVRELRAFRPVMVRVVFVAVATAAAWGLFTREDLMASAAAQASFDAHNRCIVERP